MYSRLLKILLLLLLSTGSRATHIVGGELGYQFMEKVVTESNEVFYVYQVIVRINKSVGAPGVLPPAVVLSVHTLGNNRFVLQKVLNLNFEAPMPISTTLPCTTVPAGAGYLVGVYADTIMLEASPVGYSLSTGSCCRVQDLANVANSINIGATYTAAIPSQLQPLTEYNSTPVTDDSIKVICKDAAAIFRLPFSDPDGDELRYDFCSAYNIDNDPPFTPLVYAPGFTGASPLGGNPAVTINSLTGEVRGLVDRPGDYVVCFCVHEFRNGQEINIYRKEFQYRVQLCSTTSSLPEKYYSCDDLAVSFLNDNNPTYTFKWDFGVNASLADTSHIPVPNFTYPDTGTYKVQLIVGRNTLCTDTSYSDVIVYPTFKANFAIPASLCSNIPLLFSDLTTATYGQGTKWKWYIQYPLSQGYNLVDSVQHLKWAFSNQAGADTVARVKLWSQSSKGCIDSVAKLVSILQSPLINAGPDLNFCLGDNTMINASANASQVSWQPASYLSSAGALRPFASPPITTTYSLLVSNGYCSTTDTLTIFVTPRPFPNAGKDTVLCFGDGTRLSGTGGQSFTWSPATGLSNTRIRNPYATPSVSTTYVLTVKDTLGCSRFFRDSVFVRVVPRVKINAGKDTFVVLGNPVQLNAKGAGSFEWSPGSFLDNPFKASPVANLPATQTFFVRGFTPEGCEGLDTMKVRVLEHEPDIFVPSAFSPNKDGLNDLLRPVGYGVEFFEIFAVYNRLGQQLFVSTTSGEGWDGTYLGKRQPEGAYVWQLRARDFRNKVIEKKGTTILLR